VGPSWLHRRVGLPDRDEVRPESARASTGLLFAFGLLFGVAMSPTISYYAGANPQALWQVGGATASGSPPS